MNHLHIPKKIVLALIMLLSAGLIMAQTKDIKGTVIDEAGTPIAKVSIQSRHGLITTVTDSLGHFTIPVDESSHDALIISHISYQTQVVKIIDTQKHLLISLSSISSKLDDVVVVGYSKTSRIYLTGAVSTISGNDIVRRSASNISAALAGAVPGMTVIQSSGKPGADGGTITIRGIGSINTSTAPLVLIDGVEGDLNAMDATSIESISVLKDAASAAIYGSRASNGVLLVTTKRGSRKNVSVSYTGYYGFNSPTELPQPVSAAEYMNYINTANINGGGSALYDQKTINDYLTYGADNYYQYDTHWQNLVLKNYSQVNQNSVSVDGGGERFSYFLNAGYYYQDGIIKNNNFKRFTLRINTDTYVTKWLKASLDVNIRDSKTVSPSVEDPESLIKDALTLAPIYGAVNNDGTWADGHNGLNPVAIIESGGTSNDRVPELGLKATLTAKPIKNLEFNTTISRRTVQDQSDLFKTPYQTYLLGQLKSIYPAGFDGLKSEYWKENTYTQFYITGAYGYDFKKHHLKLLAGFQTDEFASHSFSAQRTGYSIPSYQEISNGTSGIANSGTRSDWIMASYFGRFNYSFRDKYMFEATGRYDGSSRFTKDNRWGFFPSASVGWRILEEPFLAFMKPVVNDIKLRASYGELGNQALSSYYPFATTLNMGDYWYGYWFDEKQQQGIAQTAMANEAITWETSRQLNLGFDVEMLKRKLTLTFDAYTRYIDNMLQTFAIPNFVGGLTPGYQNAGSMRNRGWEFSLTWKDHVKTFDYKITANVSDVRNTVTNLYGNASVGTYIVKEGVPLNSLYGWVADGYFQSEAEIAAAPVYGGNKNNTKPGDIRYKDISGPDGKADGKIDSYDRAVIGNTFPRYEFGMDIYLKWKAFDFSLFLQGVGKKDVYLTGVGVSPFVDGRSMYDYQKNYWTEDNRSAEFPRLLIGTGNNNIISSFWLKSGAYCRIKNLSLGYNFMFNKSSKLKFTKCRLFLNARNLLTLSNVYKGYDPETSYSNGNFYPLMRTISLGLDLSF